MKTLEDLAKAVDLLIVDTCVIGPKINRNRMEGSISDIMFDSNPENFINDVEDVYNALNVGNVFTVRGVISEKQHYLQHIENIRRWAEKQMGKRDKRLRFFDKIKTLMKRNQRLLKNCVCDVTDLKIPSKFEEIKCEISFINRMMRFTESTSGADEDIVALAIYLSAFEDMSPSIVTVDYELVRKLYVFMNYSKLVDHRFSFDQKPINIYSTYEANHSKIMREVELLYETPDKVNERLEGRLLKGTKKIIESKLRKKSILIIYS